MIYCLLTMIPLARDAATVPCTVSHDPTVNGDSEMDTKQAILYCRVSTSEQGKSGLGLEAQAAALSAFAAVHSFGVVETYIEVQSGGDNDRPMLQKALAHAKRLKCPVLVARLDRLSRDVHFISGLMQRGVAFYAADLGLDVDPFVLHLFASLGEKERKLGSVRTIAGLGAAKARGVKLGFANEKRTDQAAVSQLGADRSHKLANDRAAALAATVAQIRKAGCTTLQAIGDALNARGIATPRGGSWHPGSVARLVERLAA
jgi:DNA invertase Pin-like site-specific DNA recombinase